MSKFEMFMDSLYNLAANLGTSKDKKANTRFGRLRLDPVTLTNMYQFDWLTGKITDIPADDMTRQWRTFSAPELDGNQIKTLQKSEQKIGIRKAVNMSVKWARLYGNGAVLLGLKGTGSIDTPLNLENVRPGSLKSLNVFDSMDLTPMDVNQDDPLESNFRRPTYYSIRGMRGGTRIHHTRFLHFSGVHLPWEAFIQNQYMDGSLVSRIYDAILNSQVVQEAIASIMFEAKLNVIEIENLQQKLSTPHQRTKIYERFKAADMLKSINNLLLLDSKEKLHTHTVSFSGLPDVAKTYLNVVAGAADIPATRLIGTSATGLNATGEGELKTYYNMVSSQQNDQLLTPLEYFDEIWLRSELGRVPEGWGFEFDPLWEMPPEVKAKKLLDDANRHKTHVEIGVIPPSVVTEQLFNEGVYEGIDQEMIEDIKEIEDEDDFGTGPEEQQPTPPPPNGTPQGDAKVATPPEDEDDEDEDEEKGQTTV